MSRRSSGGAAIVLISIVVTLLVAIYNFVKANLSPILHVLVVVGFVIAGLGIATLGVFGFLQWHKMKAKRQALENIKSFYVALVNLKNVVFNDVDLNEGEFPSAVDKLGENLKSGILRDFEFLGIMKVFEKYPEYLEKLKECFSEKVLLRFHGTSLVDWTLLVLITSITSENGFSKRKENLFNTLIYLYPEESVKVSETLNFIRNVFDGRKNLNEMLACKTSFVSQMMKFLNQTCKSADVRLVGDISELDYEVELNDDTIFLERYTPSGVEDLLTETAVKKQFPEVLKPSVIAFMKEDVLYFFQYRWFTLGTKGIIVEDTFHDFSSLEIKWLERQFWVEERMKGGDYVGESFLYVKKDGTPDRRARENPKGFVYRCFVVYFWNGEEVVAGFQVNNAKAKDELYGILSGVKESLGSRSIVSASQVLGVDENSLTLDGVRKAWTAAVAKYHPDKVDGLGEELKEVALRKTQEINDAYAELYTILRKKGE